MVRTPVGHAGDAMSGERAAIPIAPEAFGWNVKRAFDVTFAIGLLLVLGPALAIIALAIRLGGGGPALYRQVRIGRGGVPFEMLKFRTMHSTAHGLWAGLAASVGEARLFKLVDDPRTTRVGRLLRRTSLDELPQILNVLRGDMSFVGPRPLIPEEDHLIGELGPRRLSVLPGITGPWQAGGRFRAGLGEMIRLDCAYAERWSPLADARIIARTVWQMVRLQGL